MPSITLRPTTNSTVGWASAPDNVLNDDNDGTYAYDDENADVTKTTIYNCSDTPTDFGTMDSGLTVQVRLKENTTDANMVWDDVSVRVVNGATILAATNVGGTTQSLGNPPDSTTVAAFPASPQAFGYVNTSADKTTWDGATVEISQTRNRNKGGATVQFWVTELTIAGNYTAAAAATNAPAEAATGTGASGTSSTALQPAPATATGTGLAADASVATAVNASAEAASGTGAAADTTVAATVAAVAASGTGVAADQAVALTVPATAATGTGTAPDQTVSTATATNAPATAASGTGAAADPSTAITLPATAATGTGTAPDATVSIATSTNAPAEAATGTGAAAGPVITLTALPGGATGTGAAAGPTPTLTVLPGGATGTGAAADATVTVTGEAITANATAATGTGAAYDVSIDNGESVAPTPSGGGHRFFQTMWRPPLMPLIEDAYPVAIPATGRGVAGRVSARITYPLDEQLLGLDDEQLAG